MENKNLPVVETAILVGIYYSVPAKDGKNGFTIGKLKIEGLESNPPCLIPHEKFPEKEIPKFFKKKIRLTRNSIGQLRTSISIQDLEDQNQWLQIKFNNLENRMIERDEMVFKWMEAVENELHSLGIDLNKIREIFFMKNNEEDIEEEVLLQWKGY